MVHHGRSNPTYHRRAWDFRIQSLLVWAHPSGLDSSLALQWRRLSRDPVLLPNRISPPVLQQNGDLPSRCISNVGVVVERGRNAGVFCHALHHMSGCGHLASDGEASGAVGSSRLQPDAAGCRTLQRS
jgi:hypothetical protein